MINTNYSNMIYSGYDTLISNIGGTKTTSSAQLMQPLNNSALYGVNTANRYVTQNTQDYLTGLASSANSLQTTFNALFGNNKNGMSVFDEKTPFSSNAEAVSLSTTNQYKNDFSDKSIKVDQLATTQKNTGNALASDGKSFTLGRNTFEIEVGGKKSLISFDVTASDNNDSIQRKMATAINNADIGVKASVATDNGKKTSVLTVESKETGEDEKNNFTIRDLSAGGGSVAASGINNTVQETQNAVYSVNGEQIVSKSNIIDLGEGVTATFKKVTSEEVSLTSESNPKNAVNKVREMVNGFNAMLELAEDNKGDRGANRLYNQLTGLSSAYTASLDRIGINVSSEGYLSIDADKMNKAAESGELEKFFKDDAGANYGFANRLSRIADNVDTNPVDYVGRDKIHSSPTSGNDQMFSYLDTYRYNSLINTGLLFDMMF